MCHGFSWHSAPSVQRTRDIGSALRVEDGVKVMKATLNWSRRGPRDSHIQLKNYNCDITTIKRTFTREILAKPIAALQIKSFTVYNSTVISK